MSDLAEVDHRWAEHPYAPVLVTGQGVDVLDGPSATVGPVVRRLRAAGASAPVAVSVPGRLQVVVESLGPLGELAGSLAQAGVLHHGPGSWILLPPAVARGRPMRWIRTPREGAWRLPAAATVGSLLRVMFGASGPPVAGNGHHPQVSQRNVGRPTRR